MYRTPMMAKSELCCTFNSFYFSFWAFYPIYQLKRSLLRFLLPIVIITFKFMSKRNIMRNIKLEIGQVIRQRRKMLGLLQSQLAVISGVSLRTLQSVETGKANLSIETLMEIADPLGLTLTLVLKDLNKKDEIIYGGD
jgi:DNA-binding XRE family transcriptional regulator